MQDGEGASGGDLKAGEANGSTRKTGDTAPRGRKNTKKCELAISMLALSAHAQRAKITGFRWRESHHTAASLMLPHS